MAVRDLIAAEIEIRHLTPCIKLTFQGMSAGGVTNLGFSIKGNPIGVSKLVITADFNGFTNGSPATKTKTIYPTMFKRKTYPDSTDVTIVPDYEVSGSDYILRFALDNWIYTNCTNVKVTVSSGLYTDGGGASNAATDFVVTNNSNQGYGTTKANWAIPVHGFRMGFNEFTLQNDNSGYKEVRIVAYNVEGIDCVTVTATGQTSGYSTTITCPMAIDRITYGDYYPIVEYIGQIPISNFTQNESVNIIPKVYPFIGETAFDFSATGFSMPTARPCTHVMICDKNHTYGGCVAVVEVGAVGGTVVGFDSFNPASPPAPFPTRGAAAVAIATYNNTNYGRNNHGGGIVYMKSGSHVFVGSNITNPANSVYFITAPFPGVARDDVNFSSQSGDYYCAATFEMVNNCKFTMAADMIREADNVILYNCNSIGASTFYYSTPSAGVCTLIGGRYENCGSGLAPYSTQSVGVRVRGIYYKNATAKKAYADVIIGSHIEESRLTIYNWYTGALYGQINGGIVANNYMSLAGDNRAISIEASTTNGFAIVNNIILQQLATDTVASALVWCYGDQSDVNPCNDFVIWYNTVLGERCNWFYNDYNLNIGGPGPRLLISIMNNILGDSNHVSDVNAHGGTPDGDRYGNHALRHGTWNCGNYSRGTGQETMCAEGGNNNYNSTDLSIVDMKFVNDQSGRPGIVGSGVGDYHLNTDSPAYRLAYKKLLQYDFAGNVRNDSGSIGAYECALLTTAVKKYFYDMLRRAS